MKQVVGHWRSSVFFIRCWIKVFVCGEQLVSMSLGLCLVWEESDIFLRLVFAGYEKGKYGLNFILQGYRKPFPHETRDATLFIIIKGSIHLTWQKRSFSLFNHGVKILLILISLIWLTIFSLRSQFLLIFHTSPAIKQRRINVDLSFSLENGFH